ncbi:adhesion G-protein coupled receptor G5 [Dicentrarchus labrax]|uniref:G-protein coupled receptor 126 n=1 Tax=Dicentrarchus labrax TaxID=13489 RepID=A0A8C4GE41_DICLA|nr:adhesion G-protein coupled receptor G5 [Dicentrarchus labrax]
MMLPLGGKSRWVFAVDIVILFCGIFLTNSICESSGTNEICQPKNFLFISNKQPDTAFRFPSKVVYHEDSGSKLCFNISGNNTDCCNKDEFDCNFEKRSCQQSNYSSLILDKEILSKQDIVLVKTPDDSFTCMPSAFYSKKTGFLLNIHKCFNRGKKNIRLSQNSFCGSYDGEYDENTCNGLAETQYILTFSGDININCVTCKPPQNMSTPIPTPESHSTENPLNITRNISIILPPPKSNSLENAAYIMGNISSLLKLMGNALTAEITMGDIKGVISKLSREDPTNINVGITSDEVYILPNKSHWGTSFSRLVQIPKEASEMALKRNGSFAGVMRFPKVPQDDSDYSFFNNEVLAIEMGTKISNLSQTINIQYKNVDKNGNIASCRSWDGNANEQTWLTDGCETNETDDSITCHCSHLTFFAILLSPAPQNISSSDFTALTYITSIGCGLSMFFLAVTLFMYCVIRKQKASQATKILMNLFVAMFTLNLSFLINESIAKLGNFTGCVVMAAVMHYAMLATFTWFFMEALHLYFNLWKIPSEIKHYMMKICISGWVTPAIVVIALLALGKYDYIVINADDENSAKMCWISDADVHRGVNVGYYAVVFIFTFIVFIVSVQQIVNLKKTAEKANITSSIKTNSFSIIGLLLLLGITWAFAFFSYGPLLIPSYYIFTILNSFQGFFLFIYYYNSSKIVGENRTVSSSSTPKTNTTVTSPYP